MAISGYGPLGVNPHIRGYIIPLVCRLRALGGCVGIGCGRGGVWVLMWAQLGRAAVGGAGGDGRQSGPARRPLCVVPPRLSTHPDTGSHRVRATTRRHCDTATDPQLQGSGQRVQDGIKECSVFTYRLGLHFDLRKTTHIMSAWFEGY